MDHQTLEKVLEISRRMAETRSLAPLLDYAMGEAIKLVGAERGYLVLVRPNGELDFRVTITPTDNRDRDSGYIDQISTSILNAMISDAKPLVLRDAGLDPKFGHAKSVVMLRLRSVMCVPLRARGQTIGAIYVENRSAQGRFSEEDLAPLLLFANQAAIAIENAALNDELEERITARTRELEDAKVALEEGWNQAVEANRLRTVWLSNVTHDMRAPLTIVIGALGMLKDGDFGPLSSDQLEWITRSQDAAKRTLNLTNDVFDLSKLEFGGLKLYKENVRLDEYLRGIHQFGLGLSWAPKVKFVLQIRPGLPALALDPSRIQQVLMNLLSNAAKFTEEGTVTLHAEYPPDSGEVLIGVRDTGKGIAPEDMDKLFKRYQQFARDPERSRSGTGLGLAICRELIEMHKGRIWAESTHGVGSNFKFVLPVAPIIPSDTEQTQRT